jgi:hypothetical protein
MGVRDLGPGAYQVGSAYTQGYSVGVGGNYF